MTGWPTARPRSQQEFLAQFGVPELAEWLGLLDRFTDGTRRLLYVGSGGGRRAVPFAAAGWSVTCVERDPRAVAAFRERLDTDERVADLRPRIEVECAPIESASAAGPYDVVVVPDLIVNFVPAGEPQVAMLAACARRCAPGGVVVVDVVNPLPYVAHLLSGRPGPAAGTDVFPAEVGRERAWVSAPHHVMGLDVVQQSFHLAAVYTARFPDGEVREFVEWQHVRWLLPRQLHELAAAAGLEVAEADFGADFRWRLVLTPAG